jgi:hypothetical protein
LEILVSGNTGLFTLKKCAFLHTAIVTHVQIHFDKNGLGHTLGNFFHELIWSPWLTTDGDVFFLSLAATQQSHYCSTNHLSGSAA